MIRFDANGKVERNDFYVGDDTSGHMSYNDFDELADALDIAVAALREVCRIADWNDGEKVARDALRQIGALPTAAGDR